MTRRDAQVAELSVESDSNTRLDSWLAERLDLSRSRIAALIEAGEVTLNGTVARKRDLPRLGDKVIIRLPPPEPSALVPEAIPLEIVHEDADLLVINKPAGLVVHPAPGHRSGTLVHALLNAVHDLSGIGGVLRPGIVHRLDRDTSGLMLVAKHDAAHRGLADQLRRRGIRREYLAAAWGRLPSDAVSVDAPIGRDPSNRKRMAVVPEAGRSARTHFRRVERWRTADLIRARLETGRTHQIRVHLLHIGHPVVGDPTYAAGRERGFGGADRAWAHELARRTPRQFLHAVELEFTHPQTGATLRFEAPLPADLQPALAWGRGVDEGHRPR